MDAYLQLKPDYTIILKSSLLTFLLYWFGVPFYVLYTVIIFFIFINVDKHKYPELYSNFMKYLLLFCGIGIFIKLSLLYN
jgi:hypothetical protein